MIHCIKWEQLKKKKHPWAKDSIDFLAFVFNEEENSVELWGVEIKSRQTNDTVNKERKFNKKKRRKKHMPIGWREAAHYLLKPDER